MTEHARGAAPQPRRAARRRHRVLGPPRRSSPDARTSTHRRRSAGSSSPAPDPADAARPRCRPPAIAETASRDSRTGRRRDRIQRRATARRGTRRSWPDRTRTPAPSPARTPAPPDDPRTGCQPHHRAVTDEPMTLPLHRPHEPAPSRPPPTSIRLPERQWWISHRQTVQGRITDRRSVRDVYDRQPSASHRAARQDRSAAADAEMPLEVRTPRRHHRPWRTEILAHHDTGASNGPTEGLNLLVKEVKRCVRVPRFEHYRLRVLLRAGKPTWPNRPTPPILRTPRPHAHA